MPRDSSIQQDKRFEIGHKFYHSSYQYKYHEACSGCGRKRETKNSFLSDDFCARCGKSYMYTEKQILPLYVIGYYQNFKGENGYLLSEKSPEEIGDGSYSYLSKSESNLGKEYFETEDEV